MDTDNLLRLIFLGALALGVLVFVLAQYRGTRRSSLSDGMAWGGIFLAVVIGYGVWDDISRQATMARFDATGRVEIPRGRDGHYHLTLQVNGVPVAFVVDTGASDVVLSREDAQRVGLDPTSLRFSGRAATANGVVSTAPVRLDQVALGTMVDRNIPAQVSGGEMFGSLLGMSYLSRFDRIEIADGMLTLVR